MKIAVFSLLMLCLVACDDSSPRDEYNDFRDRTATMRESACGQSQLAQGELTDLSGIWLIRALLNGGIPLGLRIELEARPEDEANPPRLFTVKVWLEDQALDEDPILEGVETALGDDGTFEIFASPLELGPEVLSSQTTVIASVQLNAVVRSDGEFCGLAEGEATSPLNLDLSGSTFGALRYVDGLTLDEVPFRCASDPCAPDAGLDIGPDMGPADDAGVTRPEPPSVDVDSARRDLSGDWLVSASLSGLPLSLWVALSYREHDSQASVDGTLRLVADPVDAPGRAYFSAPVDESGRFEIWLPGLSLEVNGLMVQGDILLAAATIEEGWCGAAAGQVSSPIMLDLVGSTFAAVSWIPGTEVPETPPNACP